MDLIKRFKKQRDDLTKEFHEGLALTNSDRIQAADILEDGWNAAMKVVQTDFFGPGPYKEVQLYTGNSSWL